MDKIKKALGFSLALALIIGIAQPALADTVTVSVQPAVNSGLTPTRTASGLVASSRTYKVRNDGKTFLLFLKSGAGTCTVTVTTPGTIGGLSISDRTITVGASTGDIVAGPFPPRVFNDSNGDLSFTLSDTVGLSLAAIKL